MGMYYTRKYQESDFDTISGWWKHYGQDITPDLIPLHTSVILMSGKDAIMFGCLYLIEGTSSCFIENVVSKPGSERVLALETMFSFLYKLARRNKRKSVLVFTPNDKLRKRYHECGLFPTMNNVTILCRILE